MYGLCLNVVSKAPGFTYPRYYIEICVVFTRPGEGVSINELYCQNKWGTRKKNVAKSDWKVTGTQNWPVGLQEGQWEPVRLRCNGEKCKE